MLNPNSAEVSQITCNIVHPQKIITTLKIQWTDRPCIHEISNQKQRKLCPQSNQRLQGLNNIMIAVRHNPRNMFEA